jgi:hypothetical protein
MSSGPILHYTIVLAVLVQTAEGVRKCSKIVRDEAGRIYLAH